MQQSITYARVLPDGGFVQHEFSYHPQDFVYIKNREPHSVYIIGQILDIDTTTVKIEVTVQLFGRYDDVVRRIHNDGGELTSFDDVCLYFSFV